ncbi:hypothetical protein ES702_02559 [subsurface metagenome]
MGDISEMRGLVFAVTFLGVLTSLLLWIPPELYTAGESRTVYVPPIFESIEVYDFVETNTIQFNETGGSYYWIDSTFYIMGVDIGNWDCNLYYRIANETGLKVRLNHVHYEWLIFPAHHNLKWYDAQSVERGTLSGFLSVSEIQANAETGNNATSKWRASCDHFTYHTTFSYNGTTYNNFTHAWNNQDLYAFFGVDFTHVNTSYNAFHLVAMLLFFQLPYMNPYINMLLAIPLWACIAYLVYIFVLRTIGAIFGGGA